MPLVRIDVLEETPAARLPAIGDAIHRALIEAIGIPETDRFQIMTRHPPGQLVADPQYMGIHRTAGIVIVQITLNVGRTLEKRLALHAAIARNLSALPGIRAEDVLINLVEVAKENWSFGNGIAQYAT